MWQHLRIVNNVVANHRSQILKHTLGQAFAEAYVTRNHFTGYALLPGSLVHLGAVRLVC